MPIFAEKHFKKQIGVIFVTLFAMLLESQSNPSYKPSPDVAQVLWMYLF